MTPNERTPLICGYLFAVLAVLGIAGIFTLGATTATVGLFVLGLVGVVASTAVLIQVENGARPASRTG